jgi:hypothetical protein
MCQVKIVHSDGFMSSGGGVVVAVRLINTLKE